VPEEVVFQTKPQLAQAMLWRALEWGVPASWVTGDEVYGSDRRLRLWLEQEEMPHVLAIKSNESLWLGTDRGPEQVRAAPSCTPRGGCASVPVTEPRSLGCMIGTECPSVPGKRLAKGTGCWPGGASAPARGTGLLCVLWPRSGYPGRASAGCGQALGH